jgi:hypothetical protein
MCAVTDPTAEELATEQLAADIDVVERELCSVSFNGPHWNAFDNVLAAARRELARLRAPAAGAPSEAVATLRRYVEATTHLEIVHAALDTLERELAEKTARVAELEKLVYVPGLWRCAKCELRVVSTNFHVNNGRMSADNEPRQCDNGCGPMWRVSEREAGNRLIDEAEKTTDRIRELESQLAARPALEYSSEAHRELGAMMSRITEDAPGFFEMGRFGCLNKLSNGARVRVQIVMPPLPAPKPPEGT